MWKVWPLVRHPGGQEERDEPESERWTGRETELLTSSHKEVWRSSGDHEQNHGDRNPDTGRTWDGCFLTGPLSPQ